MDSYQVIMIIVLIILLLLSAFFSSAETALTTVSKIRIRALVEGGNKKATLALHILDNHYSKMLTTILIGNNVINISASAIATLLAVQVGGFMVGIVTAILTVSILVLGEIVPKTVASLRSEKLALRYIRSLNFFMNVLTPIFLLINGLSKGLMFLLRIDYNAKQSTITEDELRTLVDVIHEDGVIETEEKEMINNVFDLGDAYVKDVMVPRVHMSFANVNCSYWELIEIFKKDKYTRLPVYEETTDHIVGFINMKDLLIFDDKDNFNIRAILREAFFTHEYKNIPELLEEMRAATVSIAIVLDEYGDTAGLVTLEDIVEEIIGDIRDEHDEDEISDFQKINDLEYTVEGSIDLDDLNESLDINIESKEYESLGGYIIEQLGHHPEEGDEVTTQDNIRLVVKTIENNRATNVHIYLPEEKIFVEPEEDAKG